jgi:hypothetical protein
MNQFLDEEDNGSEIEEEQFEALSSEVKEIFGEVTGFSRSWFAADKLVKEFNPISWSLWRLIGFIMSRGLHVNTVPASMLLGYLRFLKLVGVDPVLGTTVELKTNALAAQHLKSDIIASTLFIHSIGCHLHPRPLKKIWGGMMDDALLRARIGMELGKYTEEFSTGRCLIAGFAGRMGMIVLIAMGTHQQAARTLQALARGADIVQTGLEVYSTDPFHVVAHIILRGGLGIDAAIGLLAFGNHAFVPSNDVQMKWRAVSRVIDVSRIGTYGRLTPEEWGHVNLLDPEKREDFKDQVKTVIRKGHGWMWMATPSTESIPNTQF